ncbi:DNA-directed RNA polymerase subunit beta [Nocardia takedensis]|uniref:DNA-directed RNA polymerase subunit beta n=1 Tax=Nocardia takedensis TaxID=259390 RepID=UPI003F7709CA
MSADTVQSRCQYYRSVYDLPAVVDAKTGLISFRAGLVSALEMSSQVAQAVKIDLDRRLRGGGPIISHPRNARWMFLVRSDIPAQIVERDESLWRDRVRLLTGGEQIALPSPAACGVFYRAWIHAAHSPFRPSGLVVAESVRSVLSAMDMSETTTVLTRITEDTPARV